MARVWVRSSFEHLLVTDHADLDATTAVSVLTWCYPIDSLPSSANNFRHIISKWTAYALRIFGGTSSFNGFFFTIFDGASEFNVGQTVEPTEDQWYHLAGTYDGSTVKLRVHDPVAGTTTNFTSSHSGSIDSVATNLYIGTFQTDNAEARFDGRIAEVYVFKNVALPDEEIDSVRALSHPSRSKDLYLPIYGDSPEGDLSGKGHSGAVTGTALADHAPIGPPFGLDEDMVQSIAVAAVPDERRRPTIITRQNLGLYESRDKLWTPSRRS